MPSKHYMTLKVLGENGNNLDAIKGCILPFLETEYRLYLENMKIKSEKPLEHFQVAYKLPIQNVKDAKNIYDIRALGNIFGQTPEGLNMTTAVFFRGESDKQLDVDIMYLFKDEKEIPGHEKMAIDIADLLQKLFSQNGMKCERTIINKNVDKIRKAPKGVVLGMTLDSSTEYHVMIV